MKLYDKIIALYLELASDKFAFMDGTIILQNDGDERGDYIKDWNHKSFPMPSDEHLSAIHARSNLDDK
jgi:hypothetical protein